MTSSHKLLSRSKSLSPSDETTTAAVAAALDIEQLRRDTSTAVTAVTGASSNAVMEVPVAPPVSFELSTRMSRAHLANKLCSGSGQLYVHTPAQVPTQYYICAKSLLEFTYTMSNVSRANAPLSVQRLRLRLVLFAEQQRRYVYVLAETSIPLHDTRTAASFQFFVPPLTVCFALFRSTRNG